MTDWKRRTRKSPTRRSMRTRLGVESLEERALLAVFTVTSTADAGPGTLRQAIIDSNAMAGQDDIEFDIPGVGPHTIQPLSALPSITDELHINGYTQAGAAPNSGMVDGLDTALQIVVDGSMTAGVDGIIVEADSSEIRGLVINNFDLSGIRLQSQNNIVAGNFLGTDVTGELDMGNGLDGVLLDQSPGNVIGGANPEDSNLISGNGRDGVLVFFPDASANMIVGNFIGTDRDGVQAINNDACGVEIVGGSGNQVTDNLISGSGGHGVRISAQSAILNNIINNLIGTDVSGTMPIPNVDAGVEIDNASQTDVIGNTIAFNAAGVIVVNDMSVSNSISENSMFSNTGLGIDLGNDGVTPNDVDDPDVGPNNLHNFPVITSAEIVGMNIEITYEVPSVAPNVTFPIFVEFFGADADMQEGQTFVGADVYGMPGPKMISLPVGTLTTTDFLVATAREVAGSSSEFSAAIDLEPVVIEPMGDGNESIAEATVLGSEPTVILQDSAGNGDQDFFKYTAHETGKLVGNLFFEHAAGNLDLEVQDMDGNIIASSTSLDDDEGFVIPVVGQEMYFVRVFGDDMENTYDLELENFPVPVPSAVVLDPASDNGMMNNDGITSDTTPTFLIQADLTNFNNMGIALLDAAQAAAGNVPGAGVEARFVNTADGTVVMAFADPLAGSTSLWTVTAPALTEGTWLVSARALIVDGQMVNALDHSQLSVPGTVTIDVTPSNGTAPILVESSDAGMLNNDGVTNIRQPAFNGAADPGTKVDLIATNVDTGTVQIVGTGVANQLGQWEITSEPLADATYDMTVTYFDLAGNMVTSPSTRITIDTVAPNTPFLDLLTDSGRHDADNVTNDNTPTLSVTANDTTNGGANPLPNDIKYRIYLRPDGNAGLDEQLIVDSFADLGNFTTGGFFTHTLAALPDGVHNFKLEVEDRAGNISPDFLLEVTVDATAPTKFFGDPAIADDGLQGDSDSGIAGLNGTFADRITSDTTPSFWGFAEADSVLRAFVNTPAGMVQIGQTVAQPFDGNAAFPNGRWELTSSISLNDPSLGLVDGLRQIVITGEDLAGNLSTEMTLDIFLDTLAPQVTNVQYGDLRSVFAPKPSDGPTPLSDTLLVTFTDAGNRVAPFNYEAVNPTLALDPSSYRAVGDHNGELLIDSVNFVSSSTVANGVEYVVELVFAQYLPDDRIEITVFDSIADDAGNALDGDQRGNQPGEAVILLPSGDGVPGGDFQARFTVDSRPEIGTWAAGSVYVDTNGNFVFDPENADDTNEDIVYEFGHPSDDVFAGNFVGFGEDATADGFDKLAAYGDVGNPSTGNDFRWLIDVTNDGVADLVIPDPQNVNGLPVAGRFDGNAANGDEVGLFTGNTWWFDTDHDFNVDLQLQTNQRGLPIVGDFDGDGFDDLGTYYEQEDRFEFDLANGVANGWDGVVDQFVYFGFAGVRERPAAADMDLDGVDDIGLWVPDRAGQAPSESADWYFLVSDGNSLFDRVATDIDTGLPTIEFTPQPFAADLYAQFGDEFALPIVGNFDPPVGRTVVIGGELTNSLNAMDVNNDNFVAPQDALIVINMLGDADAASHATATGMYPDVDGDGEISPRDALMVLNELNGSVQAPLSIVAEPNDGGSVNEEEAAVTETAAVDVAAVALTVPEDGDEEEARSTRSQSTLDGILGDIAEDVARYWN